MRCLEEVIDLEEVICLEDRALEVVALSDRRIYHEGLGREGLDRVDLLICLEVCCRKVEEVLFPCSLWHPYLETL